MGKIVKIVLVILVIILFPILGYLITPASSQAPSQNSVEHSAPKKQRELTYSSLEKLCSYATYVDKNKCYATYYENLTKSLGFTTSQNLFLSNSKVDNGFKGACHTIGHLYGAWLYNNYGTSIINSIIDICGFSIGHGYLEAAGLALKKDIFSEKFVNFCNRALDQANCIHGLGHALHTSKFSVLEADKFCKLISENYTDKGVKNVLCMEGFEMEDLLSNSKKWIDINSLKVSIGFCKGTSKYSYYGCRGIALRNYVVSALSFHNDFKLSLKRLTEVTTYCSKYKGEELTFCSGHIGYTLSELTGISNLNKKTALLVESYCSQVDIKDCYTPYLDSLYSLSGSNTKILSNYCSIFPLKSIDICYEKMNLIINDKKVKSPNSATR